MDVDHKSPTPPPAHSSATDARKTAHLGTRSSKRRLKADHDGADISDQAGAEPIVVPHGSTSPVDATGRDVVDGGVPSKRPAVSLASKNKKKAKTKTKRPIKLTESATAPVVNDAKVDATEPATPTSPTSPTTPRTPRLARRSTTTGRPRSRRRDQGDVPPLPPTLSPQPAHADPVDHGAASPRTPLSPIRGYTNLPAPTPAAPAPSTLAADTVPAPHPGPQLNHASMGVNRSPPKPLLLTSSSLLNTGETGETGLTPLLQNQMAIGSPLPVPKSSPADIDGLTSALPSPMPMPVGNEGSLPAAYSPTPQAESGLTPDMYGIEFTDSPANAGQGSSSGERGEHQEVMDRLEAMVSDGSGAGQPGGDAVVPIQAHPTGNTVETPAPLPMPAETAAATSFQAPHAPSTTPLPAAPAVPFQHANLASAPTVPTLPAAPRNYFAELVAAPGTRIQVTITTFLEVMDWPGFDASAFTVHEPEYHEALALEGAQIGGPLDPAALDVLALGSNGPLGGGAQTALPTAGRLPPVRPAAPPAPFAAPSAPIAVPSAPVNANAGPAQTIPSTPTNLPNGPTTTDPVTNVTTILHEGVRYEYTDQDLEEMLLLLPDSTP